MWPIRWHDSCRWDRRNSLCHGLDQRRIHNGQPKRYWTPVHKFVVSKFTSQVPDRARRVETHLGAGDCSPGRGKAKMVARTCTVMPSPLAASTFWLMMLRTITLLCFQTNSPMPTSSSWLQPMVFSSSTRRLTGAWKSYDCLIRPNPHYSDSSVKRPHSVCSVNAMVLRHIPTLLGITDLAELHWWFLR